MTYTTRTWFRLLAVVGIFIVSTFPTFHGLFTSGNGDLRPWFLDFMSFFGIDINDGPVLGFRNYRIFLYTLGMHLFGHIGFVGFMIQAKGKPYRIALMAPVILSGITVAVILLNARETTVNDPSVRLYITLGVCMGVLLYYIIDRHGDKKRKNEKNVGL